MPNKQKTIAKHSKAKTSGFDETDSRNSFQGLPSTKLETSSSQSNYLGE